MAESENHFFSVVIPTYERLGDLKICLDSLSYQNQFDAPSYEIIVSDDSNSDNSKILIEKNFPHVLWGAGKKIGPAGNRNAGVDRANGKWIVFLDDDCIAQDNYLSAYARAIDKNPDVKVFEGRIFADRPRKTWAEGCPENEHGGMLWTSNLCVERSLFIEIGKFDEIFKIAYEDVEFAHRLKQNKIQSIFVPEAAVCHPWRSLRKGGKNWKTKGYQIESLLLFLEKHKDAQDELGRPALYLKNFIRIISKNLFYCLFKLRGRGIDILLSQALVSLQTFKILVLNNKGSK
jgi:GT2 family glycosyltransferase